MSMQAAVEVLPDEEPTESMPRRSTRIAAVSSQKPVAEDTPVKSIRSRRNSAQETTDEDVIGSSQKQTSRSKTPTRSTRSPSRQIKGGDEVNGTPLKITRSRGSVASTEDNSAVSSPAPASLGTRRRSLRSASKSPTMDDKSLNGNTSTPQRPLRAATASPTLVGSNKSIPAKRGRKASVTEKVIPLESIEELESKTELLDKQNIQIESKDENFMSKKKKALIGKKNNLETITEKVKIEEIGKDAPRDITDESETTAQKQINKSDTCTVTTIANNIEESVKQSPKHNSSEIETSDKNVKPALSLINQSEMNEKLKALPVNSDVNKSPMHSNKLSDIDDSNAQNNESSVAAENTSKINKISDSMQHQNSSPESIEINLSNDSGSLNKENEVQNSSKSTEKRLEEEPMEVDEFPDNYDFSGKVADEIKINKLIQVRLSKVEVVEQLIKENLESTNLNKTPELNKTISPAISSENKSITINLSKSSLIPTSPRRSPRLLNQVRDGKEETDTSLTESKLTKITHSFDKTEIDFGDDKKETKTSVDTEDETIITLDDNVAESISDSLQEKSTNESCEPKESKLDATQDDVIELDADQSDTGNKTIEESPESDGTENDLVIFESDASRRESNELEVSPNDDTFIKNKLEDHINDNEGKIPEENKEHKADKNNVTNVIGLPVQQQHNELFEVDNKIDSKLPENEERHENDNSKNPEELQTNIQLETSIISISDSEEKATKIVDKVKQQNSNLEQSKSPLRKTEEISQFENNSEKSDLAEQENKSNAKQSQSSLKLTEEISDLVNDSEEADSSDWEKKGNLKKCRSPVKNTKDILQPEMKKSNSGDQENKSNSTQSKSLKITEDTPQLGNDLEKVGSGDEKCTSRQNKSLKATEDISDLANDSEEADSSEREKKSNLRKCRSLVKNTKDISQPEMKKSDSGDQENKSNSTQSKSLKITEDTPQLGNDLEKVGSGDEKCTSRQNKSLKATEDHSDLAIDSEEADSSEREKKSNLRKCRSLVKNTKDISQPEMKKSDSGDQEKKSNSTQGKSLKITEDTPQLGNDLEKVGSGDEKCTSRQNKSLKATEDISDLANDSEADLGQEKTSSLRKNKSPVENKKDISQPDNHSKKTDLGEQDKIINTSSEGKASKEKENENSRNQDKRENVVENLTKKASSSRNPKIDANKQVCVKKCTTVNDIFETSDSELDLSQIQKTDQNTSLDVKISNLIKYQLHESSSDESVVHYLDDMAEEGEEDTPSEGSNDIIDKGESVGSSSSSSDSSFNEFEDTYDSNDSFIDDDDYFELLSGDEYDLTMGPKPTKKAKRIIIQSSDSEVEVTNTINNEAETIKSKPDLEKSESNIEEDSDLDGMSIRPYCGLSPPSAISVKDSISDSDVVAVKDDSKILINDKDNLKSLEELKHDEPTINDTLGVTLPEVNSSKDCIAFTPNNSLLRDNASPLNTSTSRKRQSSFTIHEQVKLKDIEEGKVCDRIVKMIDVFCSNVKSDKNDTSGDISVNISVEYINSPSREQNKDALETFGKVSETPKQLDSLQKNETGEDKLEIESDSQKLEDDVQLMLLDFQDKTKEDIGNNSSLRKNKRKLKEITEANDDSFSLVVKSFKLEEVKPQTPAKKNKKYKSRKSVENIAEIMELEARDVKPEEEKASRKDKKKGDRKLIIESKLEASKDHTEIVNSDVQDLKSVEEKGFRKEKKGRVKQVVESNLQASQDQAEIRKLDVQDVKSVEEKASRKDKKRGRKLITESYLIAFQDQADFSKLDVQDVKTVEEKTSRREKKKVSLKQITESSLQVSEDDAETLHKEDYEAPPEDLLRESDEFIASKKMKHTSGLPKKLKITQKLSKIKTEKDLAETLSKKNYKSSLDDLVQESEELVTSKKLKHTSQPSKKLKAGKYLTEKSNKKDYKPSLEDLIQESKTTEVASQPLKKFSKFETEKDVTKEVKKPKSKTFTTGVTQDQELDANKVSVNRMSKDYNTRGLIKNTNGDSPRKVSKKRKNQNTEAFGFNVEEESQAEQSTFPSKIFSTEMQTATKKTTKKRRVLPTTSSNQQSWNIAAMKTSLLPSKRMKSENEEKQEFHMKDFKNKMLYDLSRVSRIPTTNLLKKKQKVNY